MHRRTPATRELRKTRLPVLNRQIQTPRAATTSQKVSPQRPEFHELLGISQQLESLHRSVFKKQRLHAFKQGLQQLPLLTPAVAEPNVHQFVEASRLYSRGPAVRSIDAAVLSPHKESPVRKRTPSKPWNRSSTHCMFWEQSWAEDLVYHAEHEQLDVDTELANAEVPRLVKATPRGLPLTGIVHAENLYGNGPLLSAEYRGTVKPFTSVHRQPLSRVKRMRQRTAQAEAPPAVQGVDQMNPWTFTLPQTGGVFQVNFEVPTTL